MKVTMHGVKLSVLQRAPVCLRCPVVPIGKPVSRWQNTSCLTSCSLDFYLVERLADWGMAVQYSVQALQPQSAAEQQVNATYGLAHAQGKAVLLQRAVKGETCCYWSSICSSLQVVTKSLTPSDRITKHAEPQRLTRPYFSALFCSSLSAS